MPTLIEIEVAISQHDGPGPKMLWSFLDTDQNVLFNFLCTIIGSMWAVSNLPDIISERVLVAPYDSDPEPGSPYEPTVFDPDKYGRNITGYTNKITNFFRVSDPNSEQVFSFDFPVETPIEEVYQRANSYGPDPSTIAPLTDLQILELKAIDYRAFGSEVFESLSCKVWAINVLAKNEGHPLTTNQLIALLTTSDTLEKALKSGSLDTAKYILGQLIAAFPQYADAGNEAVAKINEYQGTT